jgi:hypothetical protein
MAGLQDPIPLALRKSIAVYEAGKALIAYITPEYDEIARVSVCPYNMVTGRFVGANQPLPARQLFPPSFSSPPAAASATAATRQTNHTITAKAAC